jgi:hypothetical protein
MKDPSGTMKCFLVSMVACSLFALGLIALYLAPLVMPIVVHVKANSGRDSIPWMIDCLDSSSELTRQAAASRLNEFGDLAIEQAAIRVQGQEFRESNRAAAARWLRGMAPSNERAIQALKDGAKCSSDIVKVTCLASLVDLRVSTSQNMSLLVDMLENGNGDVEYVVLNQLTMTASDDKELVRTHAAKAIKSYANRNTTHEKDARTLLKWIED